MALYKEIEEIIESKRENYVKENDTVDTNKRNNLFKKKLSKAGSLLDPSCLYVLFTGLFFYLNITSFITPDDGPEWYGLFMAISFVESLIPTILVGLIFYYMTKTLCEKTGILFSLDYILFKVRNEKYKKSVFRSIMHQSLSDENIDADFMHQVSPYIKKEDMQSFLVKYKKNPTYSNFILFANEKEYLEEKRQKQRDEESVKELIGSIYDKH